MQIHVEFAGKLKLQSAHPSPPNARYSTSPASDGKQFVALCFAELFDDPLTSGSLVFVLFGWKRALLLALRTHKMNALKKLFPRLDFFHVNTLSYAPCPKDSYAAKENV